jgi:hypothetical protein
MPRTLLQRCQADNILEFRLASQERASDAQALAAAERRTGAIYLWGYVAEMTLKAAYFQIIGFADSQRITMADLNAARLSAPRLGVAPLANLHDLRGWAELLVTTRVSIPNRAYSIPGFGNSVVTAGSQIHALWREYLRYHRNRAYEHELAQVQVASQWLLLNSNNL